MLERVKYIVNILIVLLLFSAVAIRKDGNLYGNDVVERLEQITSSSDAAAQQSVEVERTLTDGTRVINTATLASDIVGFGGRTPLELFVRDGRIEHIEYLENSETPDFWDMIVRADLASQWQGMTLEEAAAAEIDGVSGATFSATSVIGNVRRGAEYGAKVEPSVGSAINFGWRELAAMVVILMGVVLTFTRSRDKRLIILQLVLNVAVLGFWCGSFLSLTTFVAWAANGVNLTMSIVTVSLAAVAIVMPLFGRKGSYCHLHCPMGSAQELLFKLPLGKARISPTLATRLSKIRYYILSALLLLMWCGVGFDLMNYEIFSIFVWGSVSSVVMAMGAIFLVLSLFMPRPYCRFVCPTGAVLTMSQKVN